MKRAFSLISVAISIFALIAIFSACPQPEGGTGGGPTGGKLYNIVIGSDIAEGNTTANGYIKASRASAASGTRITITSYPDDGYKVSFIKMNNTALTASGGSYSFSMPAANAVITAEFVPGGLKTEATIYNGGFLLNAELSNETDWSQGQGGLVGNFSEAENAGMTENAPAIKLSYTKIQNYLGVEIKHDAVNLLTGREDGGAIDGLSLYAKTTYVNDGSGEKTPAINQVVFGQYEGTGAWGKSVKYTGEENKGISLTNDWQRIIVPIPKSIDYDVTSIMLYFNPIQIEGVDVLIDRVAYVSDVDGKELVNVTLPPRGIIPYKKADTEVVLNTALNVFTMDTKLVYQMSGSRYTLYGKDADPEVAKFLNVFADFYDPGEIVYSLDSTASVSIVNGELVPAAYGSAGTSVAKLTASYAGVSSGDNRNPAGAANPSRMDVEILALPTVPTESTLVIDSFTNSGNSASGIKYTWGGFGDLQGGGNQPSWGTEMHLWWGNFLAPDAAYNWVGWFTLEGVNLDLRECSSLTIRYRGGVHANTKSVVASFSLLSGYDGVDSTLTTDSRPQFTGLRVKKSSEYLLKTSGIEASVGTAETQEVTIPLGDFVKPSTVSEGVDLSSVSGMTLILTAGNQIDIGGWAATDDISGEDATGASANGFHIESIVANR